MTNHLYRYVIIWLFDIGKTHSQARGMLVPSYHLTIGCYPNQCFGANGGDRTLNPLRAMVFETILYANSTHIRIGSELLFNPLKSIYLHIENK